MTEASSDMVQQC